MWVRKQYQYISLHPALPTFFNGTLERLQLNEQTVNQYYGKQMRVNFSNTSTLKGRFTICSADSTLTFEDVEIEQNGAMHQYLTYTISCQQINDIMLLNHDIDQSTKYYASQTITQPMLDFAKLKLVENIIHQLTSTSSKEHKLALTSIFEPLAIKNRKLYQKSCTPHVKKTDIGNNILNMQIFTDPMNDRVLLNALLEASKTEAHLAPLDVYDVLSLLHHYHHLWIHHIKAHSKLSQNKHKSSLVCKHKSSYIQWDESQTITDDDDDVAQAKDVYIESFWPFYFHGPYMKSKGKNPDWKCMRCNKETDSMSRKDKIKYYKAKRTDATMEICDKCVRSQQYTSIITSQKFFICRHRRSSRNDIIITPHNDIRDYYYFRGWKTSIPAAVIPNPIFPIYTQPQLPYIPFASLPTNTNYPMMNMNTNLYSNMND